MDEPKKCSLHKIGSPSDPSSCDPLLMNFVVPRLGMIHLGHGRLLKLGNLSMGLLDQEWNTTCGSLGRKDLTHQKLVYCLYDWLIYPLKCCFSILMLVYQRVVWKILVGGVEHLDYSSVYWEFHHPN